jgi:hypothetical protein
LFPSVRRGICRRCLLRRAPRSARSVGIFRFRGLSGIGRPSGKPAQQQRE